MLIGLFGGTFDPPHLGHLALSREALSDLSLDRLLWMLTPHPPHKRGRRLTPPHHRLAMVEIALEGTPYELSRLDLDRPAPHYAVDSIRILAEQNPGADLLYLMGSDSLNNLPSWHRAADLVASLRYIGVMRRIGETSDIPSLESRVPGLTARLRYLEAPRVDISASEVRLRVLRGQPYEHLVPPGVAEYIREHRLYFSSTQPASPTTPHS